MFGIFNDNFPPILDGVALTAQNYAFWLHEKGHDVRVITDYAPNMREVIENAKYPIDRIPSIPVPFRAPYRYGLPYMSPSFIRRLRKTDFELVHAHCPFVTGDVAYSVGMTCASTLLAPVLTPLLVLWLAGERVDVDAWGMFQQILIVTIIPIAIGFFLNVWLGHKEVFQKIQACMPGVSVASLACIVGGVITTVHDPLVENGLVLFLLTFGMVFCHNTIGYVLGYSVGRMCHFSVAKKRTLSIEVGMQNAGLGTNLAMTFFVATNPMAVVPCAISCAWHSISGTILANLFAKQKVKE